MRCASSIGTVFGYPDPVKPLMPIWSPDRIKDAASSALMIFRSRWGFKTRVVADATLMEEVLTVWETIHLTVLAWISPVCDFNHARVWRPNLKGMARRTLVWGFECNGLITTVIWLNLFRGQWFCRKKQGIVSCLEESSTART